MPITASLARSLTAAGLTIGGVVQSVSSDAGLPITHDVAAGATNYEIDVPNLTIANVVAMGIESSQDVTVLTNSTGSPVETLHLKARVPLIWATGDTAGIFTAATTLTKFYISNATASIASIKFVAVLDVTPA